MMNIIPYQIIDGIQTMTNSDIMALFDTMETEGLVDTVFYDGSVQDREAFLSVMKSNCLCVVEEDKMPIAFFWFTDRQAKRAQIHFCFFKAARGRKAREVAKFIIESIMKTDLDCIIGYIPKFNCPAINLLKKIGVEFAGVITNGIYRRKTGRSEDCYVVYFNMVPTYS
jgi:hypothetical protein